MNASSLVSVDVLAVRLVEQAVMFAVVERETDPFAGQPALPGVLLLEGERLVHAGARALKSKAGLTPVAIGQLVVFDEPSRDPRGATLSAALWAVVGEPGRADWRPIGEPGHLAFDHVDIVAECRPILSSMLWNNVTFSRALTGESFTVGDALGATTDLGGAAPDRGNLNKKLATVPGLTRAGHAPGRGRPSLWEWNPA